ncbi:MAG TPA: Ig-like domain-containing protein [Gemmatimonadales bacterium]|nr:Ig-like domain-containing protein [Gemmatimonadales bacterium]
MNGHRVSGRVAPWVKSLLAVTMAAMACTVADQTGPNAGIVAFYISPDSISVVAGQTIQFQALGTTKGGATRPLAVTWSATGGTIDQNGLYTADANPGNFEVTATLDHPKMSTKAHLVNKGMLKHIVLLPASVSMASGGQTQFSASGLMANGDSVAVSATFSASGGTITASGMYTAGSTAGTFAVIAAVDTKNGGTVADTSQVTITSGSPAAVASVTVSPATASVAVGGTVQLAATTKDANGNVLTGRSITWSSGATGTATVNGSGLVSGGAAGTATITATSEGKSGTATITVTASAPPPVATVTVSPATASVAVGATVQLAATTKDANGNVLTGRSITWSSGATGTATVSSGGLVTGVAAGTATITATSEGKSGTATITVTASAPPPVATVTVSPASASVAVGSTIQLTATTKDAGGNVLTGRTITWSSNATSIAPVNGTGLVTGGAAGSATITATSEGKSGTSAITVSGGTSGTVVFVGAGDISDCGNDNDEATAKLLDGIAGTVYTLGDNVYSNGTATEFSQCYDPTWGRHKARTKPAPGNHDYNTAGATGYFGYFGALAGPSGRGYYSFDLGNWHIISLNSEVSMSAGSAQETWLRADLAASTKQCTLAYWHKPRFSSGTNHGSLSSAQPLWQALYDFGAEIVLNGHEHNYERFAPQTPTGAADPAKGIREIISGTGGESHYNDEGTPLANSEVFNGTTFGVLKLTLGAGTYSWQFIPVAGQSFTDSGSGSCH